MDDETQKQIELINQLIEFEKREYVKTVYSSKDDSYSNYKNQQSTN